MGVADPAIRNASSASWLRIAAFAVLFVLAAMLFVQQKNAIAAVRAKAPSMLLLKVAQANAGKGALPPVPLAADLATALRAQPLDPGMVNAMMVSRVIAQKRSAPAPATMTLLARLGWRNTTVLQNRVQFAQTTMDLPKIVDLGDALMRREDLVDQARVLMNLMELTPETRARLADTLARSPSWRQTYFLQNGGLTTPQQAEARGLLAGLLAQRKAPLNRAELLPTAKLMVSKGQTRGAYGLWQDYRAMRSDAAINDPGFAYAFAMRNDALADMPFEWQPLTGNGFWGEVIAEGAGHAFTLNWNRSLVPVLLQQQLWLPGGAGGRTLSIKGTSLPATLLDDVSFELRCAKGGAMRFDQLITRTRGSLLLRSGENIPCDDPLFVVAGRPRNYNNASAQSEAMGMGEGFSATFTAINLLGAANAGPAAADTAAKSAE